jgi:hypothetical protein
VTKRANNIPRNNTRTPFQSPNGTPTANVQNNVTKRANNIPRNNTRTPFQSPNGTPTANVQNNLTKGANNALPPFQSPTETVSKPNNRSPNTNANNLSQTSNRPTSKANGETTVQNRKEEEGGESFPENDVPDTLPPNTTPQGSALLESIKKSKRELRKKRNTLLNEEEKAKKIKESTSEKTFLLKRIASIKKNIESSQKIMLNKFRLYKQLQGTQKGSSKLKRNRTRKNRKQKT